MYLISHKIFYKGLIIIILQFFFLGLKAQKADSLNAEEVLLDVFTVTSQRTPLLQPELMRTVTIITKAEIEQSAAQDLAGLLEYIRGVDIRKRGVNGIQADISIRGGSFDQTMVLLNGVNITDPQTGHHNLNIPIDINCIERVEILKGAGARIFGPNAFSGVVNIITNEPGKIHTQLSLTVGQYGLFSTNASKGFKTNNTNHFLAVNFSSCDGFTKNTDYKLLNLYYRNFYNLSQKNKLDIQWGINTKSFGANSFYSPKYPEQYEETKAVFGSIRLMNSSKINIVPVIFWRRHYDFFKLFRNNAPAWFTGGNEHMTDIIGGNVNYLLNTKIGITSFGADIKYENIYSNLLGKPLEVPVSFDVNDLILNKNINYTHAYCRKSLSILAEQNVNVNAFSFSAGFLMYANTDINKIFNLFPGLDIGIKINDDLKYFFSANRTLRLPTFTDLFYSSPINTGNPLLKPEEAISMENGFKYDKKQIHIDMSVFRRWGYNMIDWVKKPEDDKWQSMNITMLNTFGLETALKWKPLYFLKQIEKHPEFAFNYSYLYTDKYSGELISYYALDYLKHKINLSINQNIYMNFHATANVSWQDRAGTYLLYQNNNYSSYKPYKSFWLLDLKFYYKVKNFNIFIEGSNILDSPVMYISNVPQPGRWLRIGLQYKNTRQ